jgi:hypothetical protein
MASECSTKAATEHDHAAKCCISGDHKKAAEHGNSAMEHSAKAQEHGNSAMEHSAKAQEHGKNAMKV